MPAGAAQYVAKIILERKSSSHRWRSYEHFRRQRPLYHSEKEFDDFCLKILLFELDLYWYVLQFCLIET